MLIGNRKQTILIHDGTFWHVVVLAHSRGAWGVRAVENVAGRNGSRLPEELLAVAVSQHAKRVTVLLPGDVHAVRFQTPPDAEPEELQTALRYEAAHELGADAGGLRLAAADADGFALGLEPNHWLVTGFADTRLQGFAHAAVDHGLSFLGAGSLELTALAWVQTRASGDARLLLLKESTAFYAAPAVGDIPAIIATLPVGTRPDADAERERERLERAARRLATHADIPLTVLSCAPVTEAVQARLAGLFPAPEAVVWHVLGDVLGDPAQHVCTRQADDCLLVGPTPPPRDPHRAGTWLFFLILLITVAGLGAKYHALVAEEAALKARKQRWAELETARKSAGERVDALREERDAEIATREAETAARQAAREEEHARRQAARAAEIAKYKAYREARRLPAGFLPLLDALLDAMPPYTRIERLAEAESEAGIELQGSTRWQAGLPDLLQALNGALKPHGLIVQQDSIALTEGAGGVQSFAYRIVPKEATP